MNGTPVKPRPRVSDATSRIELRRRRLRHRRARIVGVALVVVALVAAGGWLVCVSSVFAVEEVSVTGASLLTDEAVEQVAQVPVGSPLATVDPQPIAVRVGAIPEVEAVTVSRSWPHTITIAITERTAVYAAKSTEAGEYWLVDRAGVTFHTVASAPKGLLVVTSTSTDVAVLRGVSTVIAALPEALRKRVASVTVTSLDNIVLILTNKAQVVWGSASDSPLKGQVAEALLKVNAKVYDVSSPSSPVTR